MRYREGFRPCSLATNSRQLAPFEGMRIPESWALKTGIQIKESGILLTIGIGNPRYTDKESRIQYLESGMHDVESRFQGCLGFPYILQRVKQRRSGKECVYESRWAGYRGGGEATGGEGVVWRWVRDLVALVLYCTVGLWWEILLLRRLAILSFWEKVGHNSFRSLRVKKYIYI